MRKKRLKLANRPIKRLKGDRPTTKRIVPGGSEKTGGCGCGRKKKKKS